MATENRNVTIRINGKEIANNIKAVEKEFHRLRNEVKKTTRGSREYQQKMAELRKTKGILDQHRKDIRGVRGSWSGFGNMIRTQLAPLFAIGTLVNVLRNAFNTIREFGAAQANLAAVLGKTREEISLLEEDAKRLGATTAFTATEVSNLQTEFAKLGFTQEEILNVTEATLQLASATGSDLSDAAATAGATVRAMGLDTSETQRVVDVMAKSFSSSALDLERWRETMKTAAPLASALDLEIEELAAMMGKMADAGIHGSMAGTSLKKIFNELSKDGRPLNEVLADVKTQLEGASSPAEKLAIANGLVGERAQAALLILAEQNQEVAGLKTVLEGAGGAAQKMADEQLNTLDGKLKILSSTWDGLILQFSEGEGGLKAIVEVITAYLAGVQVFVKDVQENLSGLNGAFQDLAGAMGFMNDEGEDTVTLFDLIAGAVRISMIPVNLFIQGIHAIVLSFQALVETGKNVVDFIQDFSLDRPQEEAKRIIGEFTQVMENMKDTVTDPFTDMFSDTSVEEKIKERGDLIRDALSGAGTDSSEEEVAGRVMMKTLERIESQKVAEIDTATEIQMTKDQLMAEGLERRMAMHQQTLDEEQQKEEAAAQARKEAYLDILGQTFDTGFQLANQAFERGDQRELDNLQKRKEMGLLSEAQYEKEKEKIQRKAFNRKKAMDIAQAIINGALAITMATAQTGVLAPGFLPKIIASTGLQVATIAAQKFEDGGQFILDGPAHSEGGMPVIDPRTGRVRAEMEGGEMIIRKNSVNPTTLPALNYINQSGQLPDINYQEASSNMKFEKGGIFPSGKNSGMGSDDISALRSIERMLKNQQVVFSLNRFEEEQEKKSKVQRLAGIED